MDSFGGSVGGAKPKRPISGARLLLVRGFGINGSFRDNAVFVGKTLVAYPIGKQIVFHDIVTQEMEFRPRSQTAKRVTAMAADPGCSYLAVCEGGREGGRALISVYKTNTTHKNITRIKTISTSSTGDILSCAFSGNGKELITMTGHPDFTLAVWQWGASKCLKSQPVGIKVTRVQVNPRNARQFTTSGDKHLRMWKLEATAMKNTALIKPAKKEQEGNFVDHTWTKRNKLLVVNHDVLMVFVNDKSASCDLRLTINLNSALVETIVAYNKGFCLAGRKGFFSVYERTDDPKEPFLLIKKFESKTQDCILSLSASPNDEKVACYNKSNTITMFPLSFVDTLDETKDNFDGLVSHGIHRAAVTSMDVCMKRPILVTCGADRQVIIWNYLDWTCQLVEEFPDVPTCVALHPCGFFLLVGSKDRVKVYNICMDKLIPMCDIASLKHCRGACFSHGGQYFACAAGINVMVYSTYTSRHLRTFVGHISPTRRIQWSPDDTQVFSAGSDGGVYSWRLEDGQRTTEMVVKQCHFTDIISNNTGKVLAMVGNDKRLHQLLNNEDTVSFAGDVMFTALAIPNNNAYVFVGTAVGTVRVYPWPLPKLPNVVPLCLGKFNLHNAPVTELKISSDQRYLFSSAEDGTVFALAIRELEGDIERAWDKPSRSFFNAGIVLSLREDVEETQNKIAALNHAIEDVQSKAKFQHQLMKTEWNEKMKRQQDETGLQLQEEEEQYAELQAKYEQGASDHQASEEDHAKHHETVTKEMEQAYEHKLSIEMARYDRLVEDMEVLQMRCEEALRQQEEILRDEIEGINEKTDKERQQYREEIQQLKDDLAENSKKFEEEQRQQSGEYEGEIKELERKSKEAIEKEFMMQARKEAEIMEQKNKMKKKNKKITVLKKDNLKQAKQNEALLAENKRLERLLSHRRRTIHEMEASLQDKEKEILNLRANNRKLNHFRYVLDNKVEELTKERGPASEHIAALEKHIKDMYDELVKEFADKKHNDRLMSKKDLKVESLTNEVNKLRTVNRDRERTINAFLHVLNNAAKVSNPKEAHEALKGMYRSFVKKEDFDFVVKNNQKATSGDMATLKEALRQRSHMVKTCATLKRALKITEEKLRGQTKRSMAQNALLINECNSLRKENKLTKILMHETQEKNKLLDRQKRKLLQGRALGSAGGGTMLAAHDPTQARGSAGSQRMSKTQPAHASTPFVLRQQQEAERERAYASRTSLASGGSLAMSRRQAGGSVGGHGSLHKGSNRPLVQVSHSQAKIAGMAYQLDENNREIEMQRLEIRRLRERLQQMASLLDPMQMRTFTQQIGVVTQTASASATM